MCKEKKKSSKGMNKRKLRMISLWLLYKKEIAKLKAITETEKETATRATKEAMRCNSI